jgi:L-threonylcarbamoyladenylate synthase
MNGRPSPVTLTTWDGDLGRLAPAADWLRAGGVVAYPTETYYGLAVDPASEAAVRALFDVKGRSHAAALPLVAASLDQVVERCGALDPRSDRLARAFWPGPLSLLLDAPAWIAVAVHAGTESVAVRVPAHALARGLAQAFGNLITSTSANRSSEPPAVTAGALAALAADPRVLVIDGGPTPGGAASTIVDARGERAVCLRDGAIAWDRVLESLKG